MITVPLTYSEEKLLRETKRLIRDNNFTFDEKIIITITEDNKEAWMNILLFAERANEIVTEQWRKGDKSIVNF